MPVAKTSPKGMGTFFMNIWIHESFVNASKGWRFADQEAYETFTNDLGKLFRSLQKTYGKASSIYIDQPSGKPPRKIGWCFSKLVPYSDCSEFYLQEVWITVFQSQPIKHIHWEFEYHSQLAVNA